MLLPDLFLQAPSDPVAKEVSRAFAVYRAKPSDAALRALLELVQQGGHGAAACVALTKVGRRHTQPAATVGSAHVGFCRSLHAVWRQILPLLLRILRLQASVLHSAAALLRRPPNEAAAVELLIQAAEAAVRGALQFKSAQLLVGALVMYLFPANPGWYRATFNPCRASAPRMQRQWPALPFLLSVCRMPLWRCWRCAWGRPIRAIAGRWLAICFKRARRRGP